MIYKVEIAKQVESDLRGIYEYIAFNLLSPENASGQLDRLQDNILKLNQMPERYKEYENEPWHSRGMRQMHVVCAILYSEFGKRYCDCSPCAVWRVWH